MSNTQVAEVTRGQEPDINECPVMADVPTQAGSVRIGESDAIWGMDGPI